MSAGALRLVGVGADEGHVDRVGEELAHLVGQPDPGRLADLDLEVAGVGLDGGGDQPQLVERAGDGAEAAPGGERHVGDGGGPAGLGLDHDRRLDVVDLAEVELQRRAAVVHLPGGRDLLAAVQVAEGDVVGVGREGGGADLVVEHGVGLALAAADEATPGGEVGDDQVDRARVEPGGQGVQQVGDPVAVGAAVVGGLAAGRHEVVGPDHEPLGEEGQHRHPSPLGPVARGDLEHAAVVGCSEPRPDLDAAQLEDGLDRRQPPGVVVVAGEGDDRRPGGGQVEQRPEHDLLGLGRRRRRVEQVARHQHHVDRLPLGDAGHLGQHRHVLLGPAPPPDGAAHVPVGRVQDLHPFDPTQAL